MNFIAVKRVVCQGIFRTLLFLFFLPNPTPAHTQATTETTAPTAQQGMVTIKQLTKTTLGHAMFTTGLPGSFSTSTSISADGTKIVFISSGNFTGSNPDMNPEIFVYDVIKDKFTQITNTVRKEKLGPPDPLLSAPFFNPSISGDGTKIVFVSNEDLTGDNCDRNHEVFLYDLNTSTLTQITRTEQIVPPPGTPPFSLSPTNTDTSINADGSKIVFLSTADLTGDNPDANQEIFLFDTITMAFKQITDTKTFNNSAPSINADGTKIVFTSQANFSGTNQDGNGEVFLFDLLTNSFTQITNSISAINSQPTISGDGNKIVFISSANYTGANPDGSDEIFLFDLVSGFKQITSIQPIPFTPTFPREFPPPPFKRLFFSMDGTKITFISIMNLTGLNEDGSEEIFVFDTTADNLTQLTNISAGFFRSLSINADGSKIIFSGGVDLTGLNPDKNEEIFLFDAAKDTFTQLTHLFKGGYNYSPHISADGRKIAFISSADLTGNNPEATPEIFTLAITLNKTTQITKGADTINILGILPFMDISRSLSINASGTKVAFISRSDLVGSNPDRNSELFIFDTDKGFIQLTDTTIPGPGIIGGLSMDKEGNRIAFTSRVDVNPRIFPQLFLFDLSKNTTTKITHTTDIIHMLPSISGDGNKIAFIRFSPPGTRGLLLNEPLLFDTNTNNTVPLIGPSPGDISDVAINDDGTKIAFVYHGDPNGTNPDLNPEIFFFDTTTNLLSQITDTHKEFINTSPSINADGTRIAFVSSADLTGSNQDGSLEIFLSDRATETFIQITDSPKSLPPFPQPFPGIDFPLILHPSINSDGSRIIFSHYADLTGFNPDGNLEIFLAEISSEFPGVSGPGKQSNSPDITLRVNKAQFVNNEGTFSAFATLNPGAQPVKMLFGVKIPNADNQTFWASEWTTTKMPLIKDPIILDANLDPARTPFPFTIEETPLFSVKKIRIPLFAGKVGISEELGFFGPAIDFGELFKAGTRVAPDTYTFIFELEDEESRLVSRSEAPITVRDIGEASKLSNPSVP